MVDTLVLEANVERRESSSLSWGTRCSEYGGIGRHNRLKICRPRACRFDSGYSHQRMEIWMSGLNQRLAKPSSVEISSAGSNPAVSANL